MQKMWATNLKKSAKVDLGSVLDPPASSLFVVKASGASSGWFLPSIFPRRRRFETTRVFRMGCGPDLQIPGPFARISNFKWIKWLNNRETRLVVEPPIFKKNLLVKSGLIFSSKSGIKNQKIVETWNHQPEIFIVRFAQVAPGRSEDQQPHEFWIHPLDALPCWKKWIFLSTFYQVQGFSIRLDLEDVNTCMRYVWVYIYIYI